MGKEGQEVYMNKAVCNECSRYALHLLRMYWAPLMTGVPIQVAAEVVEKMSSV